MSHMVRPAEPLRVDVLGHGLRLRALAVRVNESQSCVHPPTAARSDHNRRVCTFTAANSMSETVSVVIGHSLGKDEAVARLKDGFARPHGQLGSMIVLDEKTWQGDTLRFRMRALGQT